MPAATTDHFDGERAHRLLRMQVEQYGWRPAGSDNLRRLAIRLRPLLPGGRFEDLGPEHPRLRNIVGRVRGTGGPGVIVIGAHYDVEAEPRGFVGANDGAAGTAAVIELARVMKRARARLPRGTPDLRFVLFDGEEEPAGCDDFASCGLRGSKAYVRAHEDEETQAMFLFDYVAAKRARFPLEGSSTIQLWARVRGAARRAGVISAFPFERDAALLDDHVPFLERGIPAVDFIDWQYPHKDTLRDTVDKTSARSLDVVGETMAELLLHWDE